MRSVLALTGAFVLTLSTSTARADVAPACVSAYEATQTLRREGKLKASREQAIACSQPTCAAALARDCAKWFAELEETTPSVVFNARGPNGEDWLDVRVSLDGAPFADRLDGKAVILDPGPHAFRFERAGQAPVEVKIFLRDGEKNRKVSVAFGGGGSREAARAPFPVGAAVFGGVSVVAIGLAVTFGTMGLGDKSRLDQCKPDCDPHDADVMAQKLVVADVAAGVAIVAGAAALYLFFTRSAATSGAQARALSRGATFAF